MTKEYILSRIAAYRCEMRKAGVQAAIVPQSDPHQSEYIAGHWQVRRYLSGFTGSAGDLVITAGDAAIWVDSRYYLQADEQLQGTGIKVMRIGQRNTHDIGGYLCNVLAPGDKVGIDGMLFSASRAEALNDTLGREGIILDNTFDPVDKVWTDRPALPDGKVFVHEVKYAGQPAPAKVDTAMAKAHDAGADAIFVSALDEIAWMLNIRCDDVEYNPVAIAYLFLSDETRVIFINPDKITDEVSCHLGSCGVQVKDYVEATHFLSTLPGDVKVMADKATTSSAVDKVLGGRAVYAGSAVALAKACRDSVQISGLRQAMIRDGVALVKSFMQLETSLQQGKRVTEMDFGRILRAHRSGMPLYFDESFGAIVGYGPHGAIVHYEATEATDAVIEPHGLLLVDSGAQYLDGTTDITRTVSLGSPSQEERHDFTLVMKGHISLATMIYPGGTRGSQLDVEARKYLWREGKGFMHGTGHGVGHFLNVHEGPQGIRLNNLPAPLLEGMVTSNEPGIYVEGKYGIRCENLLLTVKAFTSDFGEFLKFDTLTLFPYDLTLFETEIMSDDEIKWVNDYHKHVYDTLSPYLGDEERIWLEKKTKELKKIKKWH